MEEANNIITAFNEINKTKKKTTISRIGFLIVEPK